MKNKVILTFYDVEDKLMTESVWAEKIGKNYQICNIPFFAPNIALDDIVAVEKDGNELFFEEIVQESGNSTLQIIFFDSLHSQESLDLFVKLGCTWEGVSDRDKYFAINIPAITDYSKVKPLLSLLSENNILDYKESCLSTLHRNQIDV